MRIETRQPRGGLRPQRHLFHHLLCNSRQRRNQACSSWQTAQLSDPVPTTHHAARAGRCRSAPHRHRQPRPSARQHGSPARTPSRCQNMKRHQRLRRQQFGKLRLARAGQAPSRLARFRSAKAVCSETLRPPARAIASARRSVCDHDACAGEISASSPVCRSIRVQQPHPFGARCRRVTNPGVVERNRRRVPTCRRFLGVLQRQSFANARAVIQPASSISSAATVVLPNIFFAQFHLIDCHGSCFHLIILALKYPAGLVPTAQARFSNCNTRPLSLTTNLRTSRNPGGFCSAST